jgi:hypothetical protein
LLKEIGVWILIGIVMAGAISFFLPDDFFQHYLGNEPLSLLMMLVVGIPLYICSTASTPIAAALVLKGLSPGAALVLLLAGPATNTATVTVMFRFFGKKACGLYLASIAVCSLSSGWIVNRIYEWRRIPVSTWSTGTQGVNEETFMVVSSLLLLFLIIRNTLPEWGRKGAGQECGCCSS